MSSHRLRVETGRWEKPIIPYNERKCQICALDIEDEFHFVLVCPRYSDLRKRFISKYYWSRPSMYKFIDLLNVKKKSTQKALASYCYKAFIHRTDFFK